MLENKNQILDEILELGLKEAEKNPLFSKDDFHKLKNKVYANYKLEKPISSIEFIERYNELVENGILEESLVFRKVLRKRGVRSQSGVTVISLLTKFFGCPGKCIYCPSFENLPKSYIPNEPAVMRASLNEFDPVKQIWNRLRALEITGHKIDKNDVRIIGGTWSVYPLGYQKAFIKGIYDAFNTYDEMKKYIEKTEYGSENFASFKIDKNYIPNLSKDLEEAKKINETARLRVIGIAIETRPDWIDEEEILRLRKYGVTRVEIGYQTTFDEINELNKRGHGNKESIEATKLLKNAGFKVVAHMMPNLLGSTPEKDIESLKRVFEDSDFRPDELKIYPMVVTKNSELTKIWEAGKFQAYDDETLINLTATLQTLVPEYVRINRTYRDIPSEEILEGSHLANLRQIVEEKLKAEGKKLVDIRHREIKFGKNDPKKAVLNDCTYEASSGTEHFLTFEDPEDRTIFSLLRLRLPNREAKSGILSLKTSPNPLQLGEVRTKDETAVSPLSLGEGLGVRAKGAGEGGLSALIREVHTFGDQLSIGEKGTSFGQHLGFGKRLILEAEKIAKKAGYNKMAVIAGVGVRQYYEKRGYRLEGEYMVKDLT